MSLEKATINGPENAPEVVPESSLETAQYTENGPEVVSKEAPEVVSGEFPEVARTDETSTVDAIDPVAERKLRLKCDLHVLPMLCIMYLLSFLDRVNIGNARIEGLEKELHMKGQNYNVALFVFFVSVHSLRSRVSQLTFFAAAQISYLLFEVPSNILLKNVNPSTYFSIIMFLWGEIRAP